MIKVVKNFTFKYLNQPFTATAQLSPAALEDPPATSDASQAVSQHESIVGGNLDSIPNEKCGDDLISNLT